MNPWMWPWIDTIRYYIDVPAMISLKKSIFDIHIIDGLRNQTRETLGIYAQGRLSEFKVHQIQRLIERVAKEEGELCKRENVEDYI